MRIDADRQLLFGLLALQNGLIDQAKLVDAFRSWTLDRSQTLADHLVVLGYLDDSRRTLIESLTKLYLQAHGDDLDRSLAAILVDRSTVDPLRSMANPDPDTTRSHVHPSTTDPDRIGSHSETDSETETHSGNESRSAPDGPTEHRSGHRFHVLRPHAQGGLGAVYIALDSELNREVALKRILDNHADDSTSRARFLVEAEITGGLEHPGIVPVYGLGIHDDGRPYYAMRFIQGESLHDSINTFHKSSRSDPERPLRFRRLLKSFNDVCNAIEYAHSRGVLHRDIKPRNVIVGKHGETLVVDWGMAKVLGTSNPTASERILRPVSAHRLSETLPGQVMGTPAYMSPEQARGDLEHLGPSTDVYALGALLYCLLTGKAPFQGKPAAILKAVELGNFPRPRTVDATIDPALEAIVLKAMATDPNHRYPSARALADEIDRWLANERVQAYPEPWTRSLGRWLSHHRTGVTGIAASGVVALIGLGILSTVQSRANSQLKASNTALDRQRTRAEANEAQAIEAVRRFKNAIADNPELQNNSELKQLRKTLLKEPLEFFGQLRKRLEADGDTQPDSMVRLGRVAFDHAMLVAEIDSKADAIQAIQQALDIFERLAQDHPDVADYQDGLATCLNNLGTLLHDTKHDREARTARERAVAILERLVHDHPDAIDYQGGLAAGYVNLGNLLSNGLQYEEAQTAYERAIAMLERLTRDHPENTAFQATLAASLTSMADLYADRQQSKEALNAYERAVEIRENLARDHPDVDRYQAGLAISLTNLAILLRGLGRTDQARAAYERASVLLEPLVRDHPSVTEYQVILALNSNNLGILLRTTQRGEEAQKAFERAIEIRDRLVRDHPDAIRHRSDLALTLDNLANLHTDSEQNDKARASYDRATKIREQLTRDHPDEPEFQDALAKSYNNLAILMARTGQFDDARTTYERALAIRERLVRDHPDIVRFQADQAGCLSNLGNLLDSLDRLDEARAAHEQAIAILKRLVHDHPSMTSYQASLAISLANLGHLESITNHLGEAREAYEQAVAIQERMVHDHPDVIPYQSALAISYNNLGEQLAIANRLDDAKAVHDRAIVILERLVRDHPEVTEFQHILAGNQTNLGNLLLAQNRTDEARTAYNQVIVILERLVRDHPNIAEIQLDLAKGHNNLGNLLSRRQPEEARAAYLKAVALLEPLARDQPTVPDHASGLSGALNNLAMLEDQSDRVIEARERLLQAAAWQKKALEANPRNPQYRQFYDDLLGSLMIVERKLHHDDAAAECQREQAEFRLTDPRFEPIDARIRAVLAGEAPKDHAERLSMAQRAYDTQQFHAAARFWGEALDGDPKLGDDRQAPHAWNAAQAAVRAADGQGIDPASTDLEQAQLRGRALEWLNHERVAWSRLLDSAPPEVRKTVAKVLQSWQTSAELASVRDPESVAKLPEAEQSGWKALWEAVAEVIRKAEASAS